MNNVEVNDIEYKAAGRAQVDTFLPGDLIGGNADLLITKSEQSASDPDGWVLAWKRISTGEITEWSGDKSSSDARYVPAQYVIEEAP